MTIHFVGLFSEKKDAIPILLIHGWPGEIAIALLSIVIVTYLQQGVSWNLSRYLSYSRRSIHPVPCHSI